MAVCPSIMPGMTVSPGRSMTRASAGMARCSPTAAMRCALDQDLPAGMRRHAVEDHCARPQQDWRICRLRRSAGRQHRPESAPSSSCASFASLAAAACRARYRCRMDKATHRTPQADPAARAVLLAATAHGPETAEQARSSGRGGSASPSRATIGASRMSWGSSDADAVFGAIYAQAEDDFATDRGQLPDRARPHRRSRGRKRDLGRMCASASM